MSSNSSSSILSVMSLLTDGFQIADPLDSDQSATRTGADPAEEVCESFCPSYDDNRLIYILVVYVGSTIAIISLFENVLVLCALLSDRKKRFDTFYLFLILWSVVDLMVAACYIPLIVVDLLRTKLKSALLNSVWRMYFKEALVVCNVGMTANGYLLVGMQFERVLITCKYVRALRFVRNHRLTICVGCAALAVVMKLPMYYEIQIDEQLICGTVELVVSGSELAANETYLIYKYWIRTLGTIFVPFLLLTAFNTQILCKLRGTDYDLASDGQHSTGQPHHSQAIKVEARAATRSLVLVVFMYLLGNILNLIICSWEHIDASSLFLDNCELYYVATDIVSLLTMVCCAARLPIYMLCNPEVSSTIGSFVCRVCTGATCRTGRPTEESIAMNAVLSMSPAKLNVLPVNNGEKLVMKRVSV